MAFEAAAAFAADTRHRQQREIARAEEAIKMHRVQLEMRSDVELRLTPLHRQARRGQSPIPRFYRVYLCPHLPLAALRRPPGRIS